MNKLIVCLVTCFGTPALQAAPVDPNLQGSIEYKLKNYDKAKALFEQAIKKDPDQVDSWLKLAQTVVKLKEYDRAIEAASTVFYRIKANHTQIADAFHFATTACDRQDSDKRNHQCRLLALESDIEVYYRALMEKKSKSKYDALVQAMARLLLAKDAVMHCHLSDGERDELSRGKLPDSGNGIVGFDDKHDIIVFVHDTDIEHNPPSVAVYNSSGELFQVIMTGEIYPNSGTYMGTQSFGQLKVAGSYNMAFYVDNAKRDGQVNTFKKVFAVRPLPR